MNNFNLGEVLTTSWKTIWKHKVLWVFGILASFARGGGGSSAGGGNSGYQTGSGDVSFPTEKFERGMIQIAQFFEKNLWMIIALPLILSLLPIFIGMNTLNKSFTPVYITLACCALYLPVIIFLNGILTACIQSVWTLTYLRLTKPTESAAVVVGNA